MTDQELRRLSRKDLLELLIAQGRERDALQAELEQVKAKLENRQLCVEQAGSIAEAALQLNGVFEAAQAAAQQYLENIRQRSEQVEQTCAEREAACAKLEAETRRKCQTMEAQAKEKSEAYWAEVSRRLEKFCQEHEGLKEQLTSGDKR